MKIKKEDAHMGIGACLLVTGIVLACVLLAVTAGREVGQKEIVVPYDEYKMKFYGEKEQGTYTTGHSLSCLLLFDFLLSSIPSLPLIGVGVKWFTFQRNIRDLGLKKLECLSHDKVEIDLEVRVQILMDKDALKRVVLKKFGKPELHTNFLKYMAKCAIIATCLNFTAVEYYSERSNIDKAMFETLQRSINTADFGATVEFFQLVTITLPEQLNEVIIGESLFLLPLCLSVCLSLSLTVF
jgi:hypothetical protein